ncbi:MAG TPA: heavy metal translocating P-type ATPase, partial [Thermaerobacter sp.]
MAGFSALPRPAVDRQDGQQAEAAMTPPEAAEGAVPAPDRAQPLATPGGFVRVAERSDIGPTGATSPSVPGTDSAARAAVHPTAAARALRREPGFWERHHLAVLTAITLLATLAGWVGERLQAPAAVSLFLYGIAYLAGGTPAAISGLKALRERVIDVDLLMVLAALGAAALGAWEEGAALLFLFSLSNALQAYAMDRTRQAIRALMDLAPDTAHRRRPDGGLEEVPVEALAVGDRIVVRPGERIPIDGRVVSGRSSVDQAAITGESVPVAKGPGDEVFAGT